MKTEFQKQNQNGSDEASEGGRWSISSGGFTWSFHVCETQKYSMKKYFFMWFHLIIGLRRSDNSNHLFVILCVLVSTKNWTRKLTIFQSEHLGRRKESSFMRNCKITQSLLKALFSYRHSSVIWISHCSVSEEFFLFVLFK